MRHRLMSLTLMACMASLSAPTGAQLAYLPSMGGGDVFMPVTSIRQARLAGTLLQQYDYSCGSAAVATLLTHHYGYPMSEATVFEYMYQHGDQRKIQREGFSLLDMKRFLQARGFEADGFKQTLDKLAEARLPAIALINDNGYHHFVVIKGLRGERVLIGDPAKGTRSMARQAFESAWQAGLLFVIHNRVDSARFNLAADWRAAPQAPLTAGVSRGSLSSVTMPKHGPGDF